MPPSPATPKVPKGQDAYKAKDAGKAHDVQKAPKVLRVEEVRETHKAPNVQNVPEAQAKLCHASVYIVLVGSQLGVNIGAAARVMANFGFDHLRLVRPRAGWPQEEIIHPHSSHHENISSQEDPQHDALAVAAGAEHILKKAQTFTSLGAALADITYAFALTARSRRHTIPVVSMYALCDCIKHVITSAPPISSDQELLTPHLSSQNTMKKVAIVLGSEANGLSNQQVDICSHIVTIDTVKPYTSMNISHALALACYEVHQGIESAHVGHTTSTHNTIHHVNHTMPTMTATQEHITQLMEHIEHALISTSMYHKNRTEQWRKRLRTTLSRLLLSHAPSHPSTAKTTLTKADQVTIARVENVLSTLVSTEKLFTIKPNAPTLARFYNDVLCDLTLKSVFNALHHQHHIPIAWLIMAMWIGMDHHWQHINAIFSEAKKLQPLFTTLIHQAVVVNPNEEPSDTNQAVPTGAWSIVDMVILQYLSAIIGTLLNPTNAAIMPIEPDEKTGQQDAKHTLKSEQETITITLKVMHYACDVWINPSMEILDTDFDIDNISQNSRVVDEKNVYRESNILGDNAQWLSRLATIARTRAH